MIITVKIERPHGPGCKTYRYDTAKSRRGSIVAGRTDAQLLEGLGDVVCRNMYPLPFTRHSRALALEWLTEMERRGLLELDPAEAKPTIRLTWRNYDP